jgi:hypothetical protein
MDRDPGMDTPLAPLPPAAEAPPASPAPAGRGAFLLGPVSAGLRHALACWRPLLAVLVVQLLLGLTVAVPFQARMSQRLGAHEQAGRAGVAFSSDVWEDAKRLEQPLLEGLPVVLFWVILVAWLFGAVAAGGFLGIAASPGPASVGRFFAEGGKSFGRMLRVGIVFGVALVIVGRIVFEAWGAAVESSEKAAVSEGVAWWGGRVREAAFLLFFLWFRAAADLARADLVVFGRKSALRAFVRRLGSTLRRPLASLLPALALGLPAFAAILALSLAMPDPAARGWGALLGAFLLLQAAVILRWASRAAVLAADAAIVERLAKAR